jgi:hypothetical protein
VCQATVAKYMGRRRPPPSQTWRTFLRNHVGQIAAADFVVPTVTYRLLLVLVLLAHDRRRIWHIAVTAHPTAAWTAQQLREAFPTLFWTAADLEMKLRAFQSYYNGYRAHTALEGRPPERLLDAGGTHASLHSYCWESHCRGLYQTPIAA